MSQEYRYIVRIMGTDVQGTQKTSYAVAHIKGISTSLSNAVLKKAGVNPDLRVGLLTDSDVGKIEDVLGADLAFKIKTDIDGAKDMRSWRGYRHAYSLKVRGQRTKTTGRAGKALGVKKKTLLQKPGAAPAEGGK
jgi:small subunit ribosomal protein S13